MRGVNVDALDDDEIDELFMLREAEKDARKRKSGGATRTYGRGVTTACGGLRYPHRIREDMTDQLAYSAEERRFFRSSVAGSWGADSVPHRTRKCRQ